MESFRRNTQVIEWLRSLPHNSWQIYFARVNDQLKELGLSKSAHRHGMMQLTQKTVVPLERCRVNAKISPLAHKKKRRRIRILSDSDSDEKEGVSVNKKSCESVVAQTECKGDEAAGDSNNDDCRVVYSSNILPNMPIIVDLVDSDPEIQTLPARRRKYHRKRRFTELFGSDSEEETDSSALSKKFDKHNGKIVIEKLREHLREYNEVSDSDKESSKKRVCKISDNRIGNELVTEGQKRHCNVGNQNFELSPHTQDKIHSSVSDLNHSLVILDTEEEVKECVSPVSVPNSRGMKVVEKDSSCSKSSVETTNITSVVPTTQVEQVKEQTQDPCVKIKITSVLQPSVSVEYENVPTVLSNNEEKSVDVGGKEAVCHIPDVCEEKPGEKDTSSSESSVGISGITNVVPATEVEKVNALTQDPCVKIKITRLHPSVSLEIENVPTVLSNHEEKSVDVQSKTPENEPDSTLSAEIPNSSTSTDTTGSTSSSTSCATQSCVAGKIGEKQDFVSSSGLPASPQDSCGPVMSRPGLIRVRDNRSLGISENWGSPAKVVNQVQTVVDRVASDATPNVSAVVSSGNVSEASTGVSAQSHCLDLYEKTLQRLPENIKTALNDIAECLLCLFRDHLYYYQRMGETNLIENKNLRKSRQAALILQRKSESNSLNEECMRHLTLLRSWWPENDSFVFKVIMGRLLQSESQAFKYNFGIYLKQFFKIVIAKQNKIQHEQKSSNPEVLNSTNSSTGSVYSTSAEVSQQFHAAGTLTSSEEIGRPAWHKVTASTSEQSSSAPCTSVISGPSNSQLTFSQVSSVACPSAATNSSSSRSIVQSSRKEGTDNQSVTDTSSSSSGLSSHVLQRAGDDNPNLRQVAPLQLLMQGYQQQVSLLEKQRHNTVHHVPVEQGQVYQHRVQSHSYNQEHWSHNTPTQLPNSQRISLPSTQSHSLHQVQMQPTYSSSHPVVQNHSRIPFKSPPPYPLSNAYQQTQLQSTQMCCSAEQSSLARWYSSQSRSQQAPLSSDQQPRGQQRLYEHTMQQASRVINRQSKNTAASEVQQLQQQRRHQQPQEPQQEKRLQQQHFDQQLQQQHQYQQQQELLQQQHQNVSASRFRQSSVPYRHQGLPIAQLSRAPPPALHLQQTRDSLPPSHGLPAETSRQQRSSAQYWNSYVSEPQTSQSETMTSQHQSSSTSIRQQILVPPTRQETAKFQPPPQHTGYTPHNSSQTRVQQGAMLLQRSPSYTVDQVQIASQQKTLNVTSEKNQSGNIPPSNNGMFQSETQNRSVPTNRRLSADELLSRNNMGRSSVESLTAALLRSYYIEVPTVRSKPVCRPEQYSSQTLISVPPPNLSGTTKDYVQQPVQESSTFSNNSLMSTSVQRKASKPHSVTLPSPSQMSNCSSIVQGQSQSQLSSPTQMLPSSTQATELHPPSEHFQQLSCSKPSEAKSRNAPGQLQHSQMSSQSQSGGVASHFPLYSGVQSSASHLQSQARVSEPTQDSLGIPVVQPKSISPPSTLRNLLRSSDSVNVSELHHLLPNIPEQLPSSVALSHSSAHPTSSPNFLSQFQSQSQTHQLQSQSPNVPAQIQTVRHSSPVVPSYPSTVVASQSSSHPLNVVSSQSPSQPSTVLLPQSPSHPPTAVPSQSLSCQSTVVPLQSPSKLSTVLPPQCPSRPSNIVSSHPRTVVPAQSTSHPSNVLSQSPSQPSTVLPPQPPSRPSTVIQSRTLSCQSTVVPSQSPSHPPNVSLQSPSQPSTVLPPQPPSRSSTVMPSQTLSCQSTVVPLQSPSRQPTVVPSQSPSHPPSAVPSQSPLGQPTVVPLQSPSRQPTVVSSQSSHPPSAVLSQSPSGQPTVVPLQSPSRQPTVVSSQSSHPPSAVLSQSPSGQPTVVPLQSPSRQPTVVPSQSPSHPPSAGPSQSPSGQPTVVPSQSPLCSSPNAASLLQSSTTSNHVEQQSPKVCIQMHSSQSSSVLPDKSNFRLPTPTSTEVKSCATSNVLSSVSSKTGCALEMKTTASLSSSSVSEISEHAEDAVQEHLTLQQQWLRQREVNEMIHKNITNVKQLLEGCSTDKTPSTNTSVEGPLSTSENVQKEVGKPGEGILGELEVDDLRAAEELWEKEDVEKQEVELRCQQEKDEQALREDDIMKLEAAVMEKLVQTADDSVIRSVKKELGALSDFEEGISERPVPELRRQSSDCCILSESIINIKDEKKYFCDDLERFLSKGDVGEPVEMLQGNDVFDCPSEEPQTGLASKNTAHVGGRSRSASLDSGYKTPSPFLQGDAVQQTKQSVQSVEHCDDKMYTGRELICARCQKTAFVFCSVCKATCYCSEDCQKKHWYSEHNRVCVDLEET